MSELTPFKSIIFQWLRLLLNDHTLSARATNFAVYLAVVRYNDQFGKAWPSHKTVCQDLGLKSVKTIQRLNKELDGTWFHITRASPKRSTQYVPLIATVRAAQNLRELEKVRKQADVIHFKTYGAGHFCPLSRTKMSVGTGQKCLPKKERETTKEDGLAILNADIPFARVPAAGSIFERTWNDRLKAIGPYALDRLLPVSVDEAGKAYFVPPGKWPAHPNSSEWVLQVQQIYETASKPIPAGFMGETTERGIS